MFTAVSVAYVNEFCMIFTLHDVFDRDSERPLVPRWLEFVTTALSSSSVYVLHMMSDVVYAWERIHADSYSDIEQWRRARCTVLVYCILIFLVVFTSLSAALR